MGRERWAKGSNFRKWRGLRVVSWVFPRGNAIFKVGNGVSGKGKGTFNVGRLASTRGKGITSLKSQGSTGGNGALKLESVVSAKGGGTFKFGRGFWVSGNPRRNHRSGVTAEGAETLTTSSERWREMRKETYVPTDLHWSVTHIRPSRGLVKMIRAAWPTGISPCASPPPAQISAPLYELSHRRPRQSLVPVPHAGH